MAYLLPYLNSDTSFDVKYINNVAIINCNDKLNIYNVSFFSKIIDILNSQNKRAILVNMKSLYYVDSSGLGVLLVSMNKVKENNKSFKLIALTEFVKVLFRRSNIEALFEIYETEEAAMKSLEN